MHPARILLAIAAILSAVAIGLPFLDGESIAAVRGIAARAWPAAAALGLVAVAGLAGDVREGFTPGAIALAIVVTGAATIFAVAKAIDAVEAARGIRALGGAAHASIGAWMLLAACFLGVAGSVYSANRRLGR